MTITNNVEDNHISQRKPKMHSVTRRDFLKLAGLVPTSMLLAHLTRNPDDITDVASLTQYVLAHTVKSSIPSQETLLNIKGIVTDTIYNQETKLQDEGRRILYASTYQLGSHMTYNVQLAAQYFNSTPIEPNSKVSLIERLRLRDPNSYPTYQDVNIGQNTTSSYAIGVCLASTIIGRSLLLNPLISIRKAYEHGNYMPRYRKQLVYSPANGVNIIDTDFAIATYDNTEYDFVFTNHSEFPYYLRLKLLDIYGNSIAIENPNDWDEFNALSISSENRNPLLLLCTAPTEIVDQADRVEIVRTNVGYDRYIDGVLDSRMINGIMAGVS